MFKKKILLIDGNNQFFINYSRAVNYPDLVQRCLALHRGFHTVIWVFDGFDSRKPRRDLLPNYKDTAARAKAKTDTGKYELLRTFKQEDLPLHGGILIAERPYTEADDFIRKLAIVLSNDETYIEIASNDADLLNLSYLTNVKQPQAKLPESVTHAWELDLYKTLVGDSSDNIKGLKGFGAKAWQGLSLDQRQVLYNLFKDDVQTFENVSNFLPEETNKQIKLIKSLANNWSDLKIYWKVVNYIEIPDDEVMKFVRTYPVGQRTEAQPNGKPYTMD